MWRLKQNFHIIIFFENVQKYDKKNTRQLTTIKFWNIRLIQHILFNVLKKCIWRIWYVWCIWFVQITVYSHEFDYIKNSFSIICWKNQDFMNVFVNIIQLFYWKFQNKNVIINILKQYLLTKIKNKIKQHYRIYIKFKMQFDVNIWILSDLLNDQWFFFSTIVWVRYGMWTTCCSEHVAFNWSTPVCSDRWWWWIIFWWC